MLQKSKRENPNLQEELQKLKMDYQSLENQYMIACEDRKKEERIAQMEQQMLQLQLRDPKNIMRSIEYASSFHESQLKNLEESLL